jgi:hypothetical protein
MIVIPSGTTPTTPLPTISASIYGNLISGAIISISLFNGAN